MQEYKRIPPEIDMSQGVHFVGSMLLPLKETKKEEISFERDFDF